MSDKLRETIHTFFIEKGLAVPSDPSLADALAGQLNEKPPGWDWSLWRNAKNNLGFYVSAIGVLATVLMLYLTADDTLFVRKCAEQRILTRWPSIMVVLWLIVPPIYFFFELYFRGVNKEAREMIETYQQAAQRIWLAVAAVLIALYGLSFKV